MKLCIKSTEQVLGANIPGSSSSSSIHVEARLDRRSGRRHRRRGNRHGAARGGGRVQVVDDHVQPKAIGASCRRWVHLLQWVHLKAGRLQLPGRQSRRGKGGRAARLLQACRRGPRRCRSSPPGWRRRSSSTGTRLASAGTGRS